MLGGKMTGSLGFTAPVEGPVLLPLPLGLPACMFPGGQPCPSRWGGLGEERRAWGSGTCGQVRPVSNLSWAVTCSVTWASHCQIRKGSVLGNGNFSSCFQRKGI